MFHFIFYCYILDRRNYGMLIKVLLAFVYERYEKYFNKQFRQTIENNLSNIKCDSRFVDFVCSIFTHLYQPADRNNVLDNKTRKLMKQFISVRYFKVNVFMENHLKIHRKFQVHIYLGNIWSVSISFGISKFVFKGSPTIIPTGKCPRNTPVKFLSA